MSKLTTTILSLLAATSCGAPTTLTPRQCGTVLAPYDLIQVTADHPSAPGHHNAPYVYVYAYQAPGKTSATKTLLRFNIPAAAAQQSCALVMAFPPARFDEVHLTKPDAYTPVWMSVYKVEQTPAPPPADASYDSIVRTNGPWGAWSVVEVRAGKQVLNAERCDQVRDFLVQVPEWFQDRMAVDWKQDVVEGADDGDDSFGIYLRYGDGC
jgi:hypothetical protein